jgi:hypothetical protein
MCVDYMMQVYKKRNLSVTLKKVGSGYVVEEYCLPTKKLIRFEFFKDYNNALEKFDRYGDLKIIEEKELFLDLNRSIQNKHLCYQYLDFLKRSNDNEEMIGNVKYTCVEVYYFNFTRKTIRIYKCTERGKLLGFAIRRL